ncbi:hypothetical protein QZJ86_21265 [Methylomonas montana]|uniref:hypothetical protein n=1 Tax=Methylomonas montana TaxID=3058963 RepID=UPI002659A397|nr:hypothetical protein [Methylomonas montana]WKJ90506.1 hypothetical protein QZJ86_21265 [Methylomonas montana]
MVAYLRQFLVMLLLLLQVAAPLVHAHVGKDASMPGLHLHEFEVLHIGQEGAGLMAINHDLQIQHGIVDLGSAIKQQQLLDKLAPALFLPAAFPSFAVERQVSIVNFPPPISRFAPEPLLSHNSSRAPPF